MPSTKQFNRVRVSTATSGTGTMTLGAATSNFYMSLLQAGAADGDVVSYLIEQGTDFEVGYGTVGGSSTTATRTVRVSRIGGTVGTSKIDLNNGGTPVVMIDIAKEDNDVNDFDEDTAPDPNNDFWWMHDASAVIRKKVKPINLVLARSYLAGLGIANNAGDATNDIDIAVGVAADSTNAVFMRLTSAFTKRLDANWAAGGATAGMRNSAAAITDTTYHIYLVSKASGADVDIYAHTSTTVATVITALQAETGGGSYIYARRIGSIVRATSIRAFKQNGDRFDWNVPISEFNASNPGTSAVTRTLSLPTGVVFEAIISAQGYNGTTNFRVLLTSLAQADTAPSLILFHFGVSSDTNSINASGTFRVMTNTSAQIRSRQSASGAADEFQMVTHGWIDRRGRDD